jgi:hypothetical protein
MSDYDWNDALMEAQIFYLKGGGDEPIKMP